MKNNEYKNYMQDISSQLKSNFFVYIIAVCIYFFWYITDAHLNFTSKTLHISLGHIAYVLLLVIPAYSVINQKLLQRIWIIGSAWILLDFPNLLYIKNNQEPPSLLFFSSLDLVMIILLLLLVFFLGISRTDNKLIHINTKDITLMTFSALFFMFVYHGLNFYLKVIKDVPNEDRSLYVAGLEFHHINYGVVLLIVTPFIFQYLSTYKRKYLRKKIMTKVWKKQEASMYYNKYQTDILNRKYIIIPLGYIFLGFIYGTVFDECYYYMLKDVSDEAYLYLDVILIQLLYMLTVFGLWFIMIKNKKEFYA